MEKRREHLPEQTRQKEKRGGEKIDHRNQENGQPDFAKKKLMKQVYSEHYTPEEPGTLFRALQLKFIQSGNR